MAFLTIESIDDVQKYVDKYTSVKRTQGGRATFLAGSAPIAEHWLDHYCSRPDSVCNTEFTWGESPRVPRSPPGDRTQLFDQMWGMSRQLCKTTLPLQFQDEACTATRCLFVLLSSECAVLCVYTVCVCVLLCLCSVNVDCTAGADYCPKCISLLPPIHNSDTSSFLSVNFFFVCLLCLFVPPLPAIRCIRFSACAVTQVLCWIHFPSISEAGTRAHFTAANDKQTNDSSSLFRMDHLSCTRMIKISCPNNHSEHSSSKLSPILSIRRPFYYMKYGQNIWGQVYH